MEALSEFRYKTQARYKRIRGEREGQSNKEHTCTHIQIYLDRSIAVFLLPVNKQSYKQLVLYI